MGLLTKLVIIKWHPRNRKHYENKGYTFTKLKDSFEVKIEDLQIGTKILVEVKCDGDRCTKIRNIKWQDYLKCVRSDGKHYCNKCSNIIFGSENTRKGRLKSGKSFYQWCIDNNRQDLLDRWDYELNILKPDEINYGSTKEYYFKCPRGIHKSELKSISKLTSGNNKFLKCKDCNSFAQWGIDNICIDFLDKYWDYYRNIGIDPWEISKGSNTYKVWIKCQEKDYHESYDIFPNNFINDNRCPFCNSNSGKVHYLDSLGSLKTESLNVWSKGNNKTPYDYAPMSKTEAYWKCPDNKHKEFCRTIGNSNVRDFKCPECSFSKGEHEISNYFSNNSIFYIPQKTFDGLIGLGGGLLSYDHYLAKYNLLIEYQGEMHERFVRGIHKSIKDFEKQVEHDRRKKEYALANGYNFLEIWYYDFDKIETILEKELNKIIL